MRKLSTGLVVALLGGAFLIGCGSSKSTTTSTSSTNPAATGGSRAARQLSPVQRVEVCQRIVQAPSTLSASTKAKLLKTCERVGTSTTAQREVTREACVALALREPPGAVRARALLICRRAP
jgi:hypothetical protein